MASARCTTASAAQPGAYQKALGGIRLCQARGIKVGLRFTMTERNAHHLPAMLDLVEAESDRQVLPLAPGLCRAR